MRGVRSAEQSFSGNLSLSYTSICCQADSRCAQVSRKPFLGRLPGGRWLLAGLLFLGWGQWGAAPVFGQLPVPAPKGLIWEAPVEEGGRYGGAVEALFAAYEARSGEGLGPGERGRAGLKVNTRGGRGLSTSRELLRAVIDALEARGFAREDIWIVDYSANGLRRAGILPPLSTEAAEFAGCPVLALDSGRHYDDEWFYDSPLPPALREEPELLDEARGSRSLAEGSKERKSYLPMPLLFEVDFWINLAVAADDPALGIDGVLANATLWNVSNSGRFLANQATASAAVAEIAAIPELSERMLLHLVSLERYQFIGGPSFNSLYTRSEPRLWLSGDPVAMDRLLFDKINAQRRLNGFPEIDPLPRQLPFAASLGLGHFESERIRTETVSPPDAPENSGAAPETP